MRLAPLAPLVLSACSLAPAVVWPEVPEPATPPATEADRARLNAARGACAELRAWPGDVDRIVWYGRRLAYLGHYQQAIDVYSLGLTLHPGSPHLLRHRGHRYITTRRFAEAICDLERAAQLIAGTADEVEPDGIPNARNQPTSTLHTNIWYHLGLARYCRGEYSLARRCYQRCLAAAKNPDMQVATRYWLYLPATRLEDETRAEAALAGVEPDGDVIENHAYHRLLLLFAGRLAPAEVADASADAVQDLTAAYGLLRYHADRGDTAAAEPLRARLLAAESPAFGCIAAEADAARTPTNR